MLDARASSPGSPVRDRASGSLRGSECSVMGFRCRHRCVANRHDRPRSARRTSAGSANGIRIDRRHGASDGRVARTTSVSVDWRRVLSVIVGGEFASLANGACSRRGRLGLPCTRTLRGMAQRAKDLGAVVGVRPHSNRHRNPCLHPKPPRRLSVKRLRQTDSAPSPCDFTQSVEQSLAIFRHVRILRRGARRTVLGARRWRSCRFSSSSSRTRSGNDLCMLNFVKQYSDVVHYRAMRSGAPLASRSWSTSSSFNGLSASSFFFPITYFQPSPLPGLR